MNGTGSLTLLISRDDLVHFGQEDLAYVKPVIINGHQLFAVYAADGTPILIANQRDLAFAAVRQHDLKPSSVH